MNLFRALFLVSALGIAATPSAAQSSSSGTRTTANASSRSVNSSSTSTTATSTTSTTFGNLTTTNSVGSTILTSIPITIPLSTITPTTTTSAPFPSLSGYPPCVVNCLTYSVSQANCTSIAAVGCYCASRAFPDALYTCIAANCSASVPSAESLAQQFCALDNVTLSFASTAAPSTASSAPASAATSTTSQSSTPSNAASVVSWTPDTRGWATMVLAACGALFGAALL